MLFFEYKFLKRRLQLTRRFFEHMREIYCKNTAKWFIFIKKMTSQQFVNLLHISVITSKTFLFLKIYVLPEQGFTQALVANAVFHLILSLKCNWDGLRAWNFIEKRDSGTGALLWILQSGDCFCITSNSCSHILLNSWENPLQLSLLFTKSRGGGGGEGVHRYSNIIPSLIVFQSKITVTKLSLKS